MKLYSDTFYLPVQLKPSLTSIFNIVLLFSLDLIHCSTSFLMSSGKNIFDFASNYWPTYRVRKYLCFTFTTVFINTCFNSQNTNQLTPAIEVKALQFMETGYQQELTYRRSDASFSAFGSSDPKQQMVKCSRFLESFLRTNIWRIVNFLLLGTYFMFILILLVV